MSFPPASPGPPAGSPAGRAARRQPANTTRPRPGPGSGATIQAFASPNASASPARGRWRRFWRAQQASPDGGREVFRLTAPVVIWWIWLVFAVANVIDLGLEAQPRFAAMVSVVLLTITGVAYACAFRPRVVADEGGLLVVNPIRQWRVPWAAIRQVEVRDWVRIQCARASGGDATKTIECWALFATARVKRNYSRRAQDQITRSADTARMPDEARRLMSLPTVVIIARQLERRAQQAQAHRATDHRATDHRATDHRATDERLVTSWAWPSIAAMLLPAAALATVLLTRHYPQGR